MVTMTSAEAQNQFGQLLDTVQREPVAITRHGRPAAFVVSPRDMEELQAAQERRAKALKDLDVWREEASRTVTPETALLTEEDINRIVHEVRDDLRRVDPRR
jgi:antitoxin Phd